MASSSSDALYLYALTNAEHVHVPSSGVGEGIVVMPCDSWTAVVDTVPADTWAGAQAEDNLRELAWVAPRACTHEEVVEAIMKQGPVYPARFGTLFSSADQLQHTVQKHRDALTTFFGEVNGAEEWSVKGYLDREQAAAAQMEDLQTDALSGTAYLQRRKQAQDADTAVDAWLDTVADRLASTLKAQTRALALRPATTRATPSQTPVVHWATLVPTTERAAFLRQVDALHSQYHAQGLHLEPSGPWPPYTFRPSLNDVPSSPGRSYG